MISPVVMTVGNTFFDCKIDVWNNHGLLRNAWALYGNSINICCFLAFSIIVSRDWNSVGVVVVVAMVVFVCLLPLSFTLVLKRFTLDQPVPSLTLNFWISQGSHFERIKSWKDAQFTLKQNDYECYCIQRFTTTRCWLWEYYGDLSLKQDENDPICPLYNSINEA